MQNNKWLLQENALKDLYQVEGLDNIDVYYDLEQLKTIDPTTVALAAVILVITKMSEHLIEDIYKNLKKKFKKILISREHAAKSSLDIKIAIKTKNTVVVIHDEVKSDADIERLIENARLVLSKLPKTSPKGEKHIDSAELDRLLLHLPKIDKATN